MCRLAGIIYHDNFRRIGLTAEKPILDPTFWAGVFFVECGNDDRRNGFDNELAIPF
jgi:hypothetical protein